MRDALSRNIDYLRVSVTDRCNLRCTYCMPEDLPLISHDDIMRYEEIIRLCALMAKMGIKNIKVTGGEPLARKGCVNLIKQLKSVPGIEHVTLTTNAVLLEPYVKILARLKLDGLNISLDSLDPDVYRGITGRDEFHQAWRSLERALEASLRVKINCVPIKGLNENEILPFARLTEHYPMDVRFIELMPTRAGDGLCGVSSEKIISLLLGEYPGLKPDLSRHGFGPARYFTSDRLKGSVGIIDAISSHFCSACNRLRLTGEGFLKLCLYYNDGLDLRGMLRRGASDAEIGAAITQAVYRKPKRHRFGSDSDMEGGIRKMWQIGG